MDELRFEKRLKDLKAMCESSSNYDSVIYELHPILIQILGAKNPIFINFESITKSVLYEYQKMPKIKACIEAFESLIDLRKKEKKYQVFISSTYLDLMDYRQAVADEITFMKHIPVGMEDFTACGEELDTYIKSVIDVSDYYVLLIGQRYGSEYKKDISYTMFEYQYATQKGFKVIPFIYNGNENLENNDLSDNRAKLDKFINEIKSLTPQYFKNKDELVKKFNRALNAEIKNNPQKGWIRL